MRKSAAGCLRATNCARLAAKRQRMRSLRGNEGQAEKFFRDDAARTGDPLH
jgi:hypothetical protein